MCDVSRLCVCLVSCGGSVEMVLTADEISKVRNSTKNPDPFTRSKRSIYCNVKAEALSGSTA